MAGWEQSLPALTSGHPSSPLWQQAGGGGVAASCAWDSPLLSKVLGGDLGKLHGFLVPGKES